MKISLQRWFMPWRWSRWTWLPMLAIALVTYLISPVPLAYVYTESAVPRPVRLAIIYFTIPAWRIRQGTDIFEGIDNFERNALEKWRASRQPPP